MTFLTGNSSHSSNWEKLLINRINSHDFYNLIIWFLLNQSTDNSADVSIRIYNDILFSDSWSSPFSHLEGCYWFVWNQRESQNVMAQFIVGRNCNNVVCLCLVGSMAIINRSQSMALCSILVSRYKFSFNLLLYNASATKGYRWRYYQFREPLLFGASSIFLHSSILTLHFSSSKLFSIW